MRFFNIFRVFSRRESGMTFLETVVAVAILGTIAVTFLSGLVTSSKATFTADERATARSLARSQMEWVKNASYNATEYEPASLPSESDYANYSANITTELLDDGRQRITVTIKHFDEVITSLEDYKIDR